MKRSRKLAHALPLLLGSLMLPTPVCAALDPMFLYFPTTEIVLTPKAMGLAFEEVHFDAGHNDTLAAGGPNYRQQWRQFVANPQGQADEERGGPP